MSRNQTTLYTKFSSLVLTNQLNELEKEFSHHANMINFSAMDCPSLLFLAVENNLLDMITFLFTFKNLDPNIGSTTKDSFYGDRRKVIISPLGLAIQNGWLEIVKLLLSHPQINISEGKKVIDKYYEVEIVTCLNLACSYSNPKIVELLLLRKEVEINKPCIYDNGYGLAKYNYPLTVACENNCVKIVRLLLAKSGINLNVSSDSSSDYLFKLEWSSNIGLEQVLIAYDLISRGLDYHGSGRLSKDSFSESEIKQRKFKYLTRKLVLQKFEWDRIENSNIIAFIPLLKQIVPGFVKYILQLVPILNKEEQDFIQSVIDFLIYESNQNPNKGIVGSEMKYVIMVLVLCSGACGEFADTKKLCSTAVQRFVITSDDEENGRSFSFENAFTIWKYINEYEKRFSSLIDISQFFNDGTNIGKVKNYCLSIIGKLGLQSEYEVTEILSDLSNNRDLIVALMRMRSIPYEIKDESEKVTHKFPMVKLYDQLENDLNCDVELKIEDMAIKCHKTILMSTSSYFQTELNGNWNLENDRNSMEMKYLIQFCYGFLEFVEPKYCIPLMKLANLHEIPELALEVENQAVISRENCHEYIETLCGDIEEQESEVLQNFIQRIYLYKD